MYLILNQKLSSAFIIFIPKAEIASPQENLSTIMYNAQFSSSQLVNNSLFSKMKLLYLLKQDWKTLGNKNLYCFYCKMDS